MYEYVCLCVCVYVCVRTVKLAEKQNSNFLPKLYQNSILKGINSVRKKKSFWLI